VLALVILALWQMGLLGYTYLLAGHAAREGSRELAVNTVDTKTEKPFRDAAEEDLPKAWRKGAQIEIDKDDPVTVNVKLVVPVVLPGLGSPFKVSDHASTSVEEEPLPPSQQKDPVSG
jgi:pilus assembly protein CpaE